MVANLHQHPAPGQIVMELNQPTHPSASTDCQVWLTFVCARHTELHLRICKLDVEGDLAENC